MKRKAFLTGILSALLVLSGGGVAFANSTGGGVTGGEVGNDYGAACPGGEVVSGRDRETTLEGAGFTITQGVANLPYPVHEGRVGEGTVRVVQGLRFEYLTSTTGGGSNPIREILITAIEDTFISEIAVFHGISGVLIESDYLFSRGDVIRLNNIDWNHLPDGNFANWNSISIGNNRGITSRFTRCAAVSLVHRDFEGPSSWDKFVRENHADVIQGSPSNPSNILAWENFPNRNPAHVNPQVVEGLNMGVCVNSNLVMWRHWEDDAQRRPFVASHSPDSNTTAGEASRSWYLQALLHAYDNDAHFRNQIEELGGIELYIRELVEFNFTDRVYPVFCSQWNPDNIPQFRQISFSYEDIQSQLVDAYFTQTGRQTAVEIAGDTVPVTGDYSRRLNFQPHVHHPNFTCLPYSSESILTAFGELVQELMANPPTNSEEVNEFIARLEEAAVYSEGGNIDNLNLGQNQQDCLGAGGTFNVSERVRLATVHLLDGLARAHVQGAERVVQCTASQNIVTTISFYGIERRENINGVWTEWEAFDGFARPTTVVLPVTEGPTVFTPRDLLTGEVRTEAALDDSPIPTENCFDLVAQEVLPGDFDTDEGTRLQMTGDPIWINNGPHLTLGTPSVTEPSQWETIEIGDWGFYGGILDMDNATTRVNRFFQILTTTCNTIGFDLLLEEVPNLQVFNESTFHRTAITQVFYDGVPALLEFGDHRHPATLANGEESQQFLTSQARFYTKECPWLCIPETDFSVFDAVPNPALRSGQVKDDDVPFAGAAVREHDTSITEAYEFVVFRDNVERELFIQLWYPKEQPGVTVPIGVEPISSTVVNWTRSTPTREFFGMSNARGLPLFTGTTGLPQLTNFTSETFSTLNAEKMSGSHQVFGFNSTWVSSEGTPVMLNFSWEYELEVTGSAPVGAIGFYGNTIVFIMGEVHTYADGRCWAQFGDRTPIDTSEVLFQNTGMGRDNYLDLDIISQELDDPRNLVIYFIRGVAG